MLTCEDITDQARQHSPVISRVNHKEVADAILPFVPMPTPPRLLTDDELDELYQLPECREAQRGSQISTPGEWLDMVIQRVTTSQANRARVCYYKTLSAQAEGEISQLCLL